MTTPAAVTDSQGTSLTFGSTTLTLKNVKVKRTATLIDVTPLSATSGSVRQMQTAPIVDGDLVTCEFFGSGAPAKGAKDSLTVTGGVAVSGQAICEESEITAQVGELLMGTASFRLVGS